MARRASHVAWRLSHPAFRLGIDHVPIGIMQVLGLMARPHRNESVLDDGQDLVVIAPEPGPRNRGLLDLAMCGEEERQGPQAQWRDGGEMGSRPPT